MRTFLMHIFAVAVCATSADVVHVYEQTLVNGVTTRISDRSLETGGRYSTQNAPTVKGYIFTHWTISTDQPFTPRDAWGRHLDSASFMLYEETTLTANYLPESQDSDKDGIPDGLEYYWYGMNAPSADSDTDGDGRTFKEELAAGTNPRFAERHEDGPITFADGELCQYNPLNLRPWTIRSEPEGVLFATITGYTRVGYKVDTASVEKLGSDFTYWMWCTGDGASYQVVRDAWGRALDSVTVAMPQNALEIVAVAESDYETRMKLYWYGNASVSMTSDTDGDGRTFAEELAAGTNPLMAERHEDGPVTFADGALWQYNPLNLQSWTIRSEPEGALFATTSGYVRAGYRVDTSSIVKPGDGFAYWKQRTGDGASYQAVRDAWGRAADSISVPMPSGAIEFVAVAESDYETRMKLYWYGNTVVSMTSDTDGDGRTFAEELAAGTNPLMAERHEDGPVTFADTEETEMNLQPFEQMLGTVVGGVFEQLFTSPIAGNGGSSVTFGNGSQIWPVVADVNGDKVWDLIVCSATATNVYLNVGTSGNPEFTVGSGYLAGIAADLMMNSTAKLSALSLDVEPANALSATTNGTTLLVSDVDGRIWHYQGLGDSGQWSGVSGQESGVSNSSTPTLLHSLTYTLQHKVWGGSHPGFAEGLMLAAVDWEDDGDLDCLCGTADGKLMLLRDPKVGRPTNVKALSGIDNVLLTWDPNAQSRIRGYKVYRAEADSAEFANISQPQLPTYRDFPGGSGSYDYKVSSISRFYTAGNSTPTITESPATEAVRATLDTVRFFWNDVVCKLGENANVMLSIENSLNYDVAGKKQTVSYDPAYLRPLKAAPSGLAENVKFSESFADGVWTINLESGTLAAGGGKFLTLVFETLKEGETMVGEAKVAIMAADPAKPTEVPPYSLGDVTGDGKIDEADVRELAKLKNGTGRKHTANQLKAGDFNGNGKLDDADYQALRELLKEKGLL